MGMKSLLGIAVASAAVSAFVHPGSAWADGPESAYANGGNDQSLDPGEERMTADEENQARQKDLSDAYHNGYTARAKEDAETYASLRDQLKHPPKAAASQVMPPLPPGLPPGESEAQETAIKPPQIAQRALPPQPQVQAQQPPQPQYQQVYQQPQYAPRPAPQYQQAPDYGPAPAYAEAPPQYAQPMYAQEAYAPPPPPPVQYVPVYDEAEYVPQPPVQAIVQPVVTIYRPPVYRQAYWAPRYPRAYYGYPARMYGYRGW